MQEIIPAIDRIWTGIGQSKRENVRMLCVPLAPETEPRLQTAASQVKRIVITSATAETVRIAQLLRLQIKVAASMVIYISGDPTEGFHSFGTLANVLTESDMFVASCEAEAVATRCCFPN